MITGKTKNLGVIGWPVEHSLSPSMQNAALQAARLDYIYIAMAIEPDNLAAAVDGIKKIGFKGFNVTIPHKAAIMDCLDEIDEGARVIGAVNTVAEENGRWKGYNTDWLGFIQSAKNKDIAIKNKNAVLIGAGGAASAVLWGFITSGIKNITLAVRNPAKAQLVADKFSRYIKIAAIDWQGEKYRAALNDCDILVNCTPLGMAPNTNGMPNVYWEALKKSAAVCDLIYTPEKTRFLAEGEQNGHKIMNGEGMLVGQGAAAFAKWTGVEPDLNVMASALHDALTKRK
jgi:shikimate dehydrogenase